MLTPERPPLPRRLEQRILGFQEHWQAIAPPFEWNFGSCELKALMAARRPEPQRRLAA